MWVNIQEFKSEAQVLLRRQYSGIARIQGTKEVSGSLI